MLAIHTLKAGPRRAFAPAVAIALTAFACALPATSHADDWPRQQVRVVVPFPAGGSTDIVARVLGQKLGEKWKQTVVVENRPGAGGVIGAEAVVKAPADGYVLLMASGSIFTVNPHIYPQLSYAVKDFNMITKAASGPMLVVIDPKLPPRNLQELIAYIKERPGKVNFGSAGVGSQTHMAAEAFGKAAGVSWTHVPYKGETLAYADMIAGQIQAAVGNIAALSSFVKAGKIRALAVTGTQRSALLPDVPTAAEAGLAGVNVEGWFGLAAPIGTPAAVIDKINRDTRQVLDDPDVKDKLAAQGMVAVGDSPAEMSSAVAQESTMWAAIVKDQKLVVR
ncbi:MFS transporter [Pigmentiphaga litoralis]|uniref:Bug family tripartite tricarboxylate transporter substrate binding protein n=1 Tax=Pigmentiphaga litoralis TaxID=516702 RepID=UPI0016730150|nr:tripartite tricarboxylate transporter substrate binding protein [Pigmentiphaga litoralis]GGX32202.1 MFS transporter [Pigmentiphaga litoralis]